MAQRSKPISESRVLALKMLHREPHLLTSWTHDTSGCLNPHAGREGRCHGHSYLLCNRFEEHHVRLRKLLGGYRIVDIDGADYLISHLQR